MAVAPVIDFEDCPLCDGSGWVEAGQWPCPDCDGTGEVGIVADEDEDYFHENHPH